MIYVPRSVFADEFYTNVDRCYVDESNTCNDATPSESRPGWVWSCEACDTHRDKIKVVQDEVSTEKNGRTGYPDASMF